MASEEKTWYVYLLECGDGTWYTGVTIDIDKRLKAHEQGKGSKYVARRGVRTLLRAKPCASKVEAHREEYRIKQLSRAEKLAAFD